ncbi:MAG: caspase family protein [Bacteroidia bacterium]|nr:caspase family protein [Bacteroidia bacterium]
MIRLTLPFLLIPICVLLAAPLRAQNVISQADEMVEISQKLIVLSQIPEKDPTKEAPRRTTAGLILMHQRLDKQEILFQNLLSDSDQLAQFLDYLEDTTHLWDLDKLTFRDLLADLEAEGQFTRKLRKRLIEDLEALGRIESLYADELKGIFGLTQKRGMVVRRKRWEAYLKSISAKFNAQQIMDQLAPASDYEPKGMGGTRGVKKAIWGYNLPPKTLVLTFDDGPHAKNTPRVLAILEERGIPAIFFQVGNNLATENADHKLVATSAAKYAVQIAQSKDYLTGNHTLSHQQLTKLDSAGIVREVDECYRRLREIAKDNSVFFRPPYGAFNDQVRSILMDKNTLPYMWNIDSEDWADPVAASVASRVVAGAESQGKGVILMHDIHSQTVEALPMMLDSLLAKGYKFVLWDGEKVIEKGEEPRANPVTVSTTTRVKVEDNFYRKRWALVVGINDYAHWPRLQYAVNDANGVRDALVKNLNFPEENVFLLTNKEATRHNILNAVGKLADPDRVKEDDAIFVFFAGHGMTRSLPSQRNIGYIIPADAEYESFSGSAISMTEIQDLNEMLPAKHVFWVMDACYSGLALTRGGLSNYDAQRYIREVTSRHARQMLTAGGAQEEVADGGPNGHSIFTWTLLNGLSGDADLNHDGYISASEIFNYVPPSVSSLSRQTPAYGSLVGSAGGDFIFSLKYDEELLSVNSEQHDDKTMQLLNEIEELRKKLASMETRLHSQSESGSTAQRGGNPGEVPQSSAALNAAGLAFFKKKQNEEALQMFLKAVEVDPSNVQAVNNLGFIYYEMGNHAMAEIWIKKAIELAPQRGVAYLNLGDIQLKRGETKAAIESYEKYISLVRESDFTHELSEKVKNLKSGK